MNMVILVLALVIVIFGFVVFFGAPFLPTKRQQIESALDLLNLKKGQTLLELGCGDGRVMLVAAKRGIKVVGYELNPVLALIARIRTWHYRQSTKIIWGNFWQAAWPKTDGIFVFLLDKYMQKLDKKIVQHANNSTVKLASFAFKIPSKKPTKTYNGVYLYEYK